MKRGKQTCKILKEIRKQIAEENDIKLVIEECTYHGDCLGTCPKCEAEVRYLERELEKRQRLGKAAVVAGLSVGLLGASQVAMAQTPDTIPSRNDSIVDILDGYVVPKIQQSDVMLMGKIPMTSCYHVDPKRYRTVMDMFDFSGMRNLSVVGFDLESPDRIENVDTDDYVNVLINNSLTFYVPQFEGGESDLLEFISQNLGKNADGNAYGDMEVAFTVEPNGKLSHIDIIKGVNEQLDAQVAALFKFMEWKPAIWEMKSEEKFPFACQCVQKLHFPMITH